MPLIHSKSKKAFSHNVAAEVHAGKPQKQAVAIAYSVKRRAPFGHTPRGRAYTGKISTYDDASGISKESRQKALNRKKK